MGNTSSDPAFWLIPLFAAALAQSECQSLLFSIRSSTSTLAPSSYQHPASQSLLIAPGTPSLAASEVRFDLSCAPTCL